MFTTVNVNRVRLTLKDFLCIPTPNTGQFDPLFHTSAEFRLIVNRIVVRRSTDWLAANVQFSPNEYRPDVVNVTGLLKKLDKIIVINQGNLYTCTLNFKNTIFNCSCKIKIPWLNLYIYHASNSKCK